MNSIKHLFFYFLLLLSFVSLAQTSSHTIPRSILQKVYPACIKAYGIDSLSKRQNSAQFSAVIVSAEGHILTAAHATRPGNLYKIIFPDGKEGTARALGRMAFDQRTLRPDVAMMKMEGQGPWSYAEMGWSSSLAWGQTCFGVSYPESLHLDFPMLRVGTIENTLNQWNFIETSCIMETGDSGGPLFDVLGRVIGIHSRLEKPEGANMEVPIDTYRLYWTALQQAQDYKEFPPTEDPLGMDDRFAEVEQWHSSRKVPEPIDYDALLKNVVTLSSHLNGAPKRILGTVFTLADGRKVIVSKSSEIGLTAQLEGSNIPLEILQRDKALDLVILHGGNLTHKGIALGTMRSDALTEADLSLGLVSIIPGIASGKSGVLGMAERVLPARFSAGSLGARLQEVGDLPTVIGLDSLGPAYIAGMQSDDQILKLQGEDVSSAVKINAAMEKYFIGDTVHVEYLRKQDTLHTELTLVPRQFRESNHPMNRFEGGKSPRRDGFEQVGMHDARIYAYECGSPVYSIAGDLIGINIARFSHTTCLFIPIQAILDMLRQV